jgi:hypothetical protein
MLKSKNMKQYLHSVFTNLLAGVIRYQENRKLHCKLTLFQDSWVGTRKTCINAKTDITCFSRSTKRSLDEIRYLMKILKDGGLHRRLIAAEEIHIADYIRGM